MKLSEISCYILSQFVLSLAIRGFFPVIGSVPFDTSSITVCLPLTPFPESTICPGSPGFLALEDGIRNQDLDARYTH